MDSMIEGRGSGRGEAARVEGEAAKAAPYKTPRWVQVWFLRRSRDNWKKKYMALKAQAKRLQNRVNDVTKSRERWRALAEGVEGVEEGEEGEQGTGPPRESSGSKDRDDAAPAELGAALKNNGPPRG